MRSPENKEKHTVAGAEQGLSAVVHNCYSKVSTRRGRFQFTNHRQEVFNSRAYIRRDLRLFSVAIATSGPRITFLEI